MLSHGFKEQLGQNSVAKKNSKYSKEKVKEQGDSITGRGMLMSVLVELLGIALVDIDLVIVDGPGGGIDENIVGFFDLDKTFLIRIIHIGVLLFGEFVVPFPDFFGGGGWL